MAAISVLGEDEQWIKAAFGMCVEATRGDMPLCRLTAEKGQMTVIEDVSVDPQFGLSPKNDGRPNVKAYMGAPLLLADGSSIGAVCVLDEVPRRFGPRERDLLEVISRHVVAQFQLEDLIEKQAADIKQLEEVRTELAYQARHDALTGLLNRRGLVQRLDELLGADVVNRPTITLLFIDLDDFKAVNDSMGHEVGDRVLAIIAKRTRRLLRDADLIARLGGDEFVIALATPHGRVVDAASFAKRLLDTICSPITVEGVTLQLDASVGIAETTDAPITPSQLIDNADRAMYRVKNAGGGESACWSPALSAEMDNDRAVRNFVRETTLNGDIAMHFQPVLDLESGELIRREALIRWNDEAPVPLDPARFVAVAESSGLIREVGRTVLHQSCQAAAAWLAQDPGVGVSVNVSSLQVIPALVEEVQEALQLAELAAEYLTLEITESSLLERTDAVLDVLNRLHDLGLRISIDDFGTGYSSMSMLCNLPVDEVKIDRQFCSTTDPQLLTIAEASISLGHALGLEVVAEGIETSEILDRIIGMGCESGQGFLFGRPAPVLSSASALNS